MTGQGRVAALPMYDFEELRPATDALWSAIAARLTARGVDTPGELTRGLPLHELWTDPCLLLAQSCGYPLVTSLKDRVILVATPCYRAEGCEGAAYRSAIVVRSDDPAGTLADLRGRRAAVNDAASNSGMNLLRHAIVPFAAGKRFFGGIVWTGAHAASLRMVAEGGADVAAIDCVTWAYLQDLRSSAVRGLRVLGWTAATPGLPLVTSVHTDPATLDALRAALHDVTRDPSLAPVRATLRLAGFAVLPPGAYDAVLELERLADRAGVLLGEPA